MIQFVNAKINLGLNIVERRPDGYHNLETVFYPVGLFNGTPENPEPFCDILEVTSLPSGSGLQILFSGRPVDCPPEKNLVSKAARLITQDSDIALRIELQKHLPDGAGLGGGSADATFTLKAINQIAHLGHDDDALKRMALLLGADCPFFVENRPCFAEGVGEILSPVGNVLEGKWGVIAKPDLHISTKEAFSGVSPHRPEVALREIIRLPIAEWRNLMHNDFEDSLFPLYPELGEIKARMYGLGAEYAQMSGSGAALFGIFDSQKSAVQALREIDTAYAVCCRL